MATLDIFEHRFGDETKPAATLTPGGDNTLGEAGLALLNCVQTVVDVISDDHGYQVGFANTASAFTEHGKRRITISGLPLFKAAPGTPYRDIAAIMTGFAVHEVGHTKKVGIIDAVRLAWPGKKIPAMLGNVVEDMVLERRAVERYLGLTDVFIPTLEWVAKATCPTSPLKWEGSTGHKANIVGQVARYRDFVTFTTDAATQRQLRWFIDWADAITSAMTPAEGVAHVKAALDQIHQPIEDGEDEIEQPGGDLPGPKPGSEGNPPPTTEGGEDGEDGEDGGTSGPGIPDEEDDDEPGDDDDTEGGDGNGDDGEDDDTTDGGGGDEPGPDGGVDTGKAGDDIDGETNEDTTEGGDEPGGEGGQGHGTDADTMDRSEAEKGTNDEGKGGSGQAIAEAGDEDPDAGLDETEPLDQSFDEIIERESNSYANQVLDRAVEEERITARLDAGIHGKMRVIFR